MKKHLSFSLCLFAALFATAQSSKTTFGIRGGAVQAGLQGDAVQSFQNLIDYTKGAVTTGSRTGVFGGGFVSIPVSEKFSIEPALYYSQKGYELRGALNIKGAEFIGANARAQLTTQYIDLPVLAKANFNGFQVFAGPQVSYLADANLRVSAGALGFTFLKNTQSVTNNFNRVDLGLTGGVGYQLGNGVNLTAAYDHGLSKVDKNQNFDLHNRVVRLGVGFRF